MFILEEKGETMKKNLERDFMDALKDGRVKVIPISMDSDNMAKDIDFHNIISNMIKENKVPNDVAFDLNKLFNFKEQEKSKEHNNTENNKSAAKEGVLTRDVVLSDNMIAPKGTEFKILEKVDENKVKVSFSTYIIEVLGVKSKNSNLEVILPMSFYTEHVLPKINYLKELNTLTEQELNIEVINLDGDMLHYIKKERLVRDLMKDYNLYKSEKVTAEDVVNNRFTVDYNLLDRAMLSLGYICSGKNKNIYIK